MPEKTDAQTQIINVISRIFLLSSHLFSNYDFTIALGTEPSVVAFYLRTASNRVNWFLVVVNFFIVTIKIVSGGAFDFLYTTLCTVFSRVSRLSVVP